MYNWAGNSGALEFITVRAQFLPPLFTLNTMVPLISVGVSWSKVLLRARQSGRTGPLGEKGNREYLSKMPIVVCIMGVGITGVKE